MCVYLDGGVVFVLIARLDSFEPLDDRLDVTADFTLEGRGSPVIHSGIDRMGARQDGFRVGTLCRRGHTHTHTKPQREKILF